MSPVDVSPVGAGSLPVLCAEGKVLVHERQVLVHEREVLVHERKVLVQERKVLMQERKLVPSVVVPSGSADTHHAVRPSFSHQVWGKTRHVAELRDPLLCARGEPHHHCVHLPVLPTLTPLRAPAPHHAADGWLGLAIETSPYYTVGVGALLCSSSLPIALPVWTQALELPEPSPPLNAWEGGCVLLACMRTFVCICVRAHACKLRRTCLL